MRLILAPALPLACCETLGSSFPLSAISSVDLANLVDLADPANLREINKMLISQGDIEDEIRWASENTCVYTYAHVFYVQYCDL